MNKKFIAITVFIIVLIPLFSGCVEKKSPINKKPVVEISYPDDSSSVSKIVTISGTASDPNGDNTIKMVEIYFNDTWHEASGTIKWSYDWDTYKLKNGLYEIAVRAWDGNLYSGVEELVVSVNNPNVLESESHKWAIFTFVGNFPENNESKLGNGGFYLSEEMASYLVEEKGYPTSNIYILFDDGWIRNDNGFGERLKTLQERFHRYDFFYGAATKNNFISVVNEVVEEANNFKDSEVFLWLSGHGCGDNENTFTGGKIFERSSIYLWDNILTDKELGILLQNLKSEETCVFVDACYSGGFADKTIFNIPELFLYNSGIPKKGRVVISSASKFRLGYANLEKGPLFTILWYTGLISGEADGFRSGFLNRGKSSKLDMFKDGKVSVEEAFFYAKHLLRNDKTLEDFNKMKPQISDRYPRFGLILNNKGLILG